MSLNHDFLLIEKDQFDKNGYEPYMYSKDALLIHDDIISYIYDSLLWIPALNSFDGQSFNGINRWGITLYGLEGSIKIEKIFQSWANLFKEGPKELMLTGDWTYSTKNKSEDEEPGSYEKLYFERDLIVTIFEGISEYARQVIENKNKFIILHLGI